MAHEKYAWKPFGRPLLGFTTNDNGEIVGTGLLNTIIDKLSLGIVLYFQVKFYTQYTNLATWKGKRVASPFAPPVGSFALFRVMKALIKTHTLKIHSPIAVTFAVTYRCQCRCPHCSAANHIRKDVNELSTKEAKRVIDESIDELGVGVITFTGGEPLLREDIFELISYVDKRKAVALMFTNGLLLSDDVIDKLVDAGLYSLHVSLDSTDPDEHDRLRGFPGLFKAATEGLERAKDKELLVAISSYASRSNTERGYYRKMHKLGKKLGVHTVTLFDTVPTGKLLKDTSEMLTPKQKEELANYNANIFKQRITPPLASQSWQNSIEGYLGGIGCVAGYLQYYVSAYGDVAPCDFTPISFGNIREESLKNIWKKIVSHPAYNHRTQACRMQNSKFRRLYIDAIPDDAILPYDIDKLPRVDYRKQDIA